MPSEPAVVSWSPEDPELVHCARMRHGEGRAPASALAAYVAGERVASGLVGTIDGSGSAPQTTTAFRVASCTKSFTAAAILWLRDRGLLGLEDDVRKYLPTLKVIGPAEEPAGAVLTLCMLLSMSAGLPTDDPWADRQESMGREDFAQLISRGVRLVREPGSGYEYSNLGYALLGQVVEKVSGSAYTTFIEHTFLQPLGMSGTAFSKAELLARIAAGTTTATAVATGYRKKGGAPASTGQNAADLGWSVLPMTGPGVFSAIGGLLSTLDDLGRWASWLQAAFSGEEPNGTGPLSRETRREMQTMQQVTAPREDDGTLNGYGYGLVVQHHGVYGMIIGHSGGYPGFSAHMRWPSEHGAAIVGFENATYSKVGIAVRTILESHLAKTMTAPAVGGAVVTAPADPQPVMAPHPAAELAPWPEAVSAMGIVGDFVRRQAVPESVDVFSPNVALDLPWEERLAALREALAVVGPLEGSHAPRWATPASAEWELAARDGALLLRISLTPVSPPRVQLLEISPRP